MTTLTDKSMQQRRSRPGLHAAAAAVIVGATLVAFWPSLFNGLTVWDDDVNITNNPHVQSLSAENIRWMFFSHRHGHYQPLTWLSFAVDRELFGPIAFGHHVTNLVVHILAALAFYMLIIQLLRRATADADNGPPLVFAATAGALIFAIHPLRVESVAWATERRDVLSGLFFVLTISAYLKMVDARGAGRVAWFGLALLIYAAALLSKVMVVSLPPVLLLLDVYPLRRIGLDDRPLRRAAFLLLEKIPFFALGIGASALAINAQTGADTMLTFADYGVAARLRQVVFGYGFYAYRTLVPANLATLYELRGPIAFTNAGFWASLLFVAAATAFCVSFIRRQPAFLVVWLAYLVILFPVSGLFQNGPQIVADRYSYLSCLGFAVLAAGGLLALFRIGRSSQRVPVGVLCAAAVISLGGLTWRLSQMWASDEALWRQAVALDPASGLGRFNLAKALADRGEHDEAITLYEAVIKDQPTQPRTYYAFANSLAAMGRLDESIDAYRRALTLNPAYLDALNNLGNTYWRADKPELAVAAFREALRLAPDYATARFNLGRTLLESGRPTEAAVELRALLERHPDHIDGRCQLAFALAGVGRLAGAIGVLREGLDRRPASPALQGALALFLATSPDLSLRDGGEAVRLTQQLIDSGKVVDPVILGTLAAGLAELGRFDEAVAAAEDSARQADQQGDPQLAAEVRAQADRYRRGLRYGFAGP